MDTHKIVGIEAPCDNAVERDVKGRCIQVIKTSSPRGGVSTKVTLTQRREVPIRQRV